MKQVISVNVDEFEGDVSVKRNINLGGNITAQGNAHIKKNLRVDGYIDCPNFKGPNKGLFNNLDSLKESYPNPIDGWWALVGDTLPAQLFIVVNGEWCDSGFVVGDGLEIDLTDINEMIEKIQDSLANISSPILPFYGIYNTSDDFKIIDTFDGILREMKVVYFIDKKRFCLLYGQYIIEQWSDSWQYMNDNMPRGDRLYVMNNRLYQFDGTSLVLLGSNGISPFDIVQNRGNSKEKAMSQDAVSREFENIESMIDMPLPIFDGVAPSGIELNEKGGARLDNGSILFSAELGSFVCLVGEKYYASWLDTNGTRQVELYNIFDAENNKSNAVTNKLFICNNKLYFFNGENLIELGSEIPSSAFNQNKSLSIDANGNIKWKSIIPAFYEIITENTPVTEVRLSEYNNSDNIIYFLSNAHFANLSKVFPIFAKKNIYGEYIIPNTYNPNIDEYNYKKGNSISPIQNKIYECITNKQQYYFDGKTLRLLSDNHLKEVSYKSFMSLMANGNLIPGTQYLIPDFVNYYTYTAYRNYNNFISIIVTADSSSTINPYARLADGSATIKIRIIDSIGNNSSNYLNFEGSKCHVLNSANIVTYNNIAYTELYMNVVNTDTYYYTYVKKDEWDSIHNGYGNLFWVNYYIPQPLPVGTGGLPKGIKFDPEQHYLRYINIGEYKPEYSADDCFLEIIWMRDSNGNEAPYEFLHNDITTFNGTCKNNIIKIPYYYDSMSPYAYIKLTDCNGNNITVTNDKLHITEINSCNNNEILLTSNSKRITLSNIDNSLIVDSEENTHIHKKTLAQELGEDETSAISQKGVKNAIDDVNTIIDDINTTITNLEIAVDDKITETKNEVNTYTDNITNKIKPILPITFINSSSLEHTTEKPTKPTTVYFNVKDTSFYAKDESGTYHSNWDAFAANIDDKITNFPDSTIYKSHMGFLQHTQSNYLPFLYTSKVDGTYKPAVLKVSFFDSEYIEESSSLSKTVYINQDLFIELKNNSKCTVNYRRTITKLLRRASYYAPIYTSQVIIKTAYNPSITFTIPSTLGGIDEVIWENGEPPVFDSYKYYILDFKEMYIKNDSKTKLLITYKSFSYENPNPDYVDLGLPSGTLWATKNVGAASPEEYGNYYAWGETETKEEYTQENSLIYGLTPSELQTQGIIDDNNNLTSQFDAASVNLGSDWRMPTVAEMLELRNNCIIEFIILNGINGARFTGPNGNSIFLPAAGIYFSSGLDKRDNEGVYFSSELSSNISDSARTLYFVFNNNSIITGQQAVYEGIPIRPVRNIETNN